MGWEIQPSYMRIGMDLLVLVQEEKSYVGRVISYTQFFWSHFLYLVGCSFKTVITWLDSLIHFFLMPKKIFMKLLLMLYFM